MPLKDPDQKRLAQYQAEQERRLDTVKCLLLAVAVGLGIGGIVFVCHNAFNTLVPADGARMLLSNIGLALMAGAAFIYWLFYPTIKARELRQRIKGQNQEAPTHNATLNQGDK